MTPGGARRHTWWQAPGRALGVLCVGLLLAGAAAAQQSDEAKPTDPSKPAETSLTREEIDAMTPAEREALRDETLSSRVSEYNEGVEGERDQVVCRKEKRTGSRQAQQVCKTMREWDEEKAASRRMLLKRGRASSNPADVEGNAGGNPR